MELSGNTWDLFKIFRLKKRKSEFCPQIWDEEKQADNGCIEPLLLEYTTSLIYQPDVEFVLNLPKKGGLFVFYILHFIILIIVVQMLQPWFSQRCQEPYATKSKGVFNLCRCRTFSNGILLAVNWRRRWQASEIATRQVCWFSRALRFIALAC